MRKVLITMALASAGCAAAKESPEFAYSTALDVQAVAGVPTPKEVSAPSIPREPAHPDRKIIFSGSLLLQVPDPELPEKEMRRIVEEAQGWVHKIEGTSFTLRVPADRFQSVMDQLTRLGKLIDRKVSGTDVTEEYFDLEIRLQNAENVRKRLAALLEKAKDVKEAIEVEKELARVSEEIERMKGRLRYLYDQVAHSTIVVSFQRTVPPHLAAKSPRFPFPWIRDLGIDHLTHFRTSP